MLDFIFAFFQTLMITKERVEKMGLAVVYGDTDSIMINTNTKDVPAAEMIGRKVGCVENVLNRNVFVTK